MSDNQHDQILRIVVQGQQDLETVVKLVRQLEQETGNSSKNMNKSLGGLKNTFVDLAKAAGDAKGATAGGVGNTQAWDTLKNKVLAAAQAYRTLNQAQIASGKTPLSAAQFLASPANSGAVSAKDIAAFQQGSNVNLFDAMATRGAQSLPRLRYALYDVATTATFTGLAMTGLAVAVGAVAITMDRQFADVVRTSGTYMDKTGTQTAALRGQFEELFSSIPTTWSSLTQIGTLAGQLDIPKQSIAEFTKLVTMFSATTNVSVEESATAFGRLAQLLKVPATEYQNLGSAVLRVGVNSVATESQILSVTKEIAPMANTAGFAADQVIGLAGALASLGVQPELARGFTTRFFTNIQSAVSAGGDKLAQFAQISGTTSDQFAQQWGTDASGAIQKLLTNIGRMDKSSAVAAIQSLGITAARDIPAVLRLAQNSDLLASSLKDAAGGYASGKDVAQQYSVISSTVAEKLHVLVNNFQLLVDHLGKGTTVLGGFIDGLIGLLSWFQKLADNPFTATIAAVLLGVGALGGIALIVTGSMARFTASMLAVRTAAAEMSATTGLATFSLRNLATTMLGAGEAGTVGARGIAAMSIAAKALSAALILMIAIPLVDQIRQWVFEADGAVVSIDRLGSALDKVAGGDQAAGMKTIENQIRAISKAANEFSSQTGPQGPVAGRITTGVTKDLSSAQAALDNGLAVLGKKQNDFGFLNGWLSPARDQTKAFAQTFADAWGRVSSAMDQQRLLDFFTQLHDQARDAALAGGQSARDFEAGWRENMAPAIEAIGSGVDSMKLLSEQTQATADSIKDTISSFLDVADAAITSEGAIYDLGAALGENGAVWSVYSQTGRENMGALMGVVKAIAAETPGDAASIASNLQALFNSIVQGGYASAGQLTMLQQIIDSLSGGQTVAPAQRDFSSFFAGIQTGADRAQAKLEQMRKKAQQSAKEAVKEVRTLVDYANDLGGVFSRSFDLRFGNQQGLDAIALGWQKIQQEMEDAQKSLDDLYAKQTQLAASKSTKEYQLGIAETYGDEKRAVEIRADLTDVNNQLAQNQNDIVKAQDAMKLSLQGNSAAAIQHRSDILGLVQTYDGYVKTLAASGLSQDELKTKVGELKQQFIDQATQMGFSGDDVQTYAKHFDDLATIVGTVPRNVTVDANTNPALQALNEFIARANAAKARVQVDATDASGIGAGAANQFKVGFKSEMLRAPIPISGYQVLSGGQQVYQVAGHNNTMRLFETGGYTGVGGAKDVAGAVHAGEFVLSKPAVDFFGVGFLNRLHMAGKNGSYGSLNSGGTGPMELSPRSIDQLARAIAYYGPDLTIGNDAIGAAARSSNATSNSQGRY